jgi:hypothetical protein
LFFQGGEAEEWLDKTVSVPNVSSFGLPEWIAEFERLKKVNAEIIGGKGHKPTTKRNQKKSGRRG